MTALLVGAAAAVVFLLAVAVGLNLTVAPPPRGFGYVPEDLP